MNNFVREALNATMPLTPPAPLDWIMALGAGQAVVVDDSQTSVTLNLQQGDVVRGPFHKLTSTTITSGLRYGVGPPPTPGNVTGQNAVSGVAVPTGPTAGQVLQATSGTTAQWQALFAVAPVATIAVANQATMTGLAQTIDGVALSTAGMRVYLANQTTASQNGIWLVQSGAWTRPADWATGNTPPLGTIISVAPGGTSNWNKFGGLWMVTTTGVIDTATVTAYPRVCKGQGALATGSPSTLTVTSLWVLSATQSIASAIEVTTASNNLLRAVLTADGGTPGSGQIVITGPNTLTDTIAWLITNW